MDNRNSTSGVGGSRMPQGGPVDPRVGVAGQTATEACGESTAARTMGIAPATYGSALSVLQFTDRRAADEALDGDYKAGKAEAERVGAAAREVASYHRPTEAQARAHQLVSDALAFFLQQIVRHVPAGPERSTAISRAREAKFWASAGIALEGR